MKNITIKSNKSKRTFTLVTDIATYRSVQLSKEEFEAYQFNTANDWLSVLNNGNFYRLK